MVVVTGVRGGPPRTVADSPAPIDVIQGDALLKTGRTELGEALANLLPAMNFGTNEGGITSIVRPVINRGLGPGYTLILINGKRRHNGSQITNGGGDTSGVNPVDLDMIPISAIDYIEVLKDSAAAQYGSDAVAGVINIVLKKDPEGGRVDVTAGRLYSVKGGDPNGDRANADAGFRLGKDGFLHLFADAHYRGNSWDNFQATQTPYAPAGNPENQYWDHVGAHNGDPGIKAFNVGYNLAIPIGKATLYSFGTFGPRWTVVGNNLRYANGLADFDNIYPQGYFPLNNTREADGQIVVGVKGAIEGWHLDLSSSYGRNDLVQYSNFTINPSLGPTSPTSFNNLGTYIFDQWVQNFDATRGFEVGLARPLQLSGGLELRTEHYQTIGGEYDGYHNGGYVFQPGDQVGNPNVGAFASPGAQSATVVNPSDAVNLNRNVLAAYVDSGIYPLKNWYNGVAVRAEHYTDAGNTIGGKLNSRLDLLEELAFRGTIGNGFRAPSLTQIGYSEQDNRTNINPLTGIAGPSLSLIVPTTAPLAQALGAQPLKPEQSINFGLGTVIRPLKKLTLTIDGYEIDIKNRIDRTSTLLGPSVAPVLQQNGYTGSEYVTYFANMYNTRSRGVDAVAEWSHDFREGGFLVLSAAYNYNRTDITGINPTPSALLDLPGAASPKNSLVFLSRAVAGDVTVNNPRSKLILHGRWHIGPVKVSLTETRYGAYDYVATQIVSEDSKFGAKWLTDIDLAYTTEDRVEFGVGAANVFNVYPDKNGPAPLWASTGSSGAVYGPAPFAPTGGFYYGRVAYNF